MDVGTEAEDKSREERGVRGEAGLEASPELERVGGERGRSAAGDAESAAGVGKQGHHRTDVVAVAFVSRFEFGFGWFAALRGRGEWDRGFRLRLGLERSRRRRSGALSRVYGSAALEKDHGFVEKCEWREWGFGGFGF